MTNVRVEGSNYQEYVCFFEEVEGYLRGLILKKLALQEEGGKGSPHPSIKLIQLKK